MGKLADFFKKLKSKKNIEIIIAIILCIVILIIFLSGWLGSKRTAETPDDVDTFSEYCRETEARLIDLIKSLGGTSNISVAISFSNTAKTVYQEKVTSVTVDGTTTETSDIVYVDGKPLIVEELLPEVLGVAVVATGRDPAILKLQITQLVSTLLNINSSKIQVITYSK
jgi:stage III sporulation protein AG